MARLHNSKQDSVGDSGVVLLLQVPRTNDKKELAAEQMFASLHGLLTIPVPGLLHNVRRERVSFEIAVRQKRIGFYVWVPDYLKSYVEEQIYAQYPTVHISEVEDYAAFRPEEHHAVQLVTELKFTSNNALPIKTFQNFEVDPLAAITATLAKFTDDEEAWIQLLVKPAASQWHRNNERYVASMKAGGNKTMGLMSALWKPPEVKAETAKLSDHETTRVSAAEEKAQKLAFETQLRIVYRGNAPKQQAQLQMQSIIASYKQFNSTYLNGFEAKRVQDDQFLVAHFRSRAFNRAGFICNIEEIATLYHLPHTNVETPFILWATSQTAEPPANLPLVTPETQGELSPIAATNFRGHNTMFGMPRSDRGRHLYIIGQTGTGKSGLLELLTISDVYSPYGFAVIDPHGDYAQAMLRRIPAERAADVVYFNPADTDFPMGFNPLEVYDPKLKTHTCSELIGVIKRMFEASWGPRLEYILRYSILALLDFPDATMLDITRILTEKKFRQEVLRHVNDPVVRNFWTMEFASWNDKFMTEAVAPILNKVGAFTANPLVRNIIGQPKSSFNVRQIMDERKILIVNLSRGLVGEDNAALLGALLVTKVQMAAMSRADTPGEYRTPFYLYVDEFQNFATDSFATILSEARKYGLCLTVANQYTAQMMQEVKDAVFGNVGSIIAFRTSADDARSMMKYFEPKFDEHSMVHMHNRHFAISMTIGGEKVPAFSAISLNLPPFTADYGPQIIEHSRARYTQPREHVERYMAERYAPPAENSSPAKQSQPRPVRPAQPEARPVDFPAAALSRAALAQPVADEPAKPKRKRTRRRKKKTAVGNDGSVTVEQVARAIEEGVIHLK
ncbi:MAG TPA: type IV secretion system DNA-binding domain-containing protein [Candidatus Saccharimonadales bacterium]|nr:type IV secretion system DNA-binding domain-containing protein [Candidatus Saccharimonadales bacterium]